MQTDPLIAGPIWFGSGFGFVHAAAKQLDCEGSMRNAVYNVKPIAQSLARESNNITGVNATHMAFPGFVGTGHRFLVALLFPGFAIG